MTHKHQNSSSPIDCAFNKKDFNLILSILKEKPFSSTKLLVFYKQRNKSKIPLFKISEFWTSELPLFYLKEIIESDLKITFLESYFSNSKNNNPELNNHLLTITKSDFIMHFKLWKAFKHPSFYNSFKQISRGDNGLERVVNELEIIINAQNKIDREYQEDKNLFLQYSFGEFALAFHNYYNEIKQRGQILGNFNRQAAIEMTLVNELDTILKIFKGNKNMTFENINNSNPQILQNSIDRLVKRRIQKNLIELYISGYADFQSVIIIAPLVTNSNYRAFQINNTKNNLEELYLSKIGNPQNKIQFGRNFWEFYKLPKRIIKDRVVIDINKVLKLLECYSKDIPTDGIRVFDYEKLIISISEDYNWLIDEVKTLMSFLVCDINSEHNTKTWLDRPFIKSNNQIYWLGIFLKDRRWKTIILNRLKKENDLKSYTIDGESIDLKNEIAKNFELRIEELFKSKSFKTLSCKKYTSANGQSGDFDVLAFKDNYLFVCEAKTGTRNDDFYYAKFSETVKLEGCAAEQLNKAYLNINEDWENIKIALDVDNTVELNNIEIIKLIITDFFEGDLQLYKESIRKISLLELDVILNNKKKDLLESDLLYTPIINSNNPNIKQQTSLSNINWDLWNGKNEIEVEDIVINIDQNSIWKELEIIREFEDESGMLNY